MNEPASDGEPERALSIHEENGEDADAREPSGEDAFISQKNKKSRKKTEKGWFSHLRAALSRSSGALQARLSSLFSGGAIDETLLQDMEDTLVQADLGVENAILIVESVKRNCHGKTISAPEMSQLLANEIERLLAPSVKPLNIREDRKPHVILVVGVNGSGKTTTIGKLAERFQTQGKKVVLAAGDTFRAAAADQLKIWAKRTGSSIIARDAGADAAGLIFDAIGKAREDGDDLLLADTAGRLQNRRDLMDELKKIVRVIRRQDPTAPHDVLLVLDATTGQNALEQVDAFKESAGVTGLIVTKLDGTARGGVLLSIAARHGLPVHAIGVGEEAGDLRDFTAHEFAYAITGAHPDPGESGGSKSDPSPSPPA